MLIFNEEVAERAESKSHFDLVISNSVKDAMRAESVATLIELLEQVLSQF